MVVGFYINISSFHINVYVRKQKNVRDIHLPLSLWHSEKSYTRGSYSTVLILSQILGYNSKWSIPIKVSRSFILFFWKTWVQSNIQRISFHRVSGLWSYGKQRRTIVSQNKNKNGSLFGQSTRNRIKQGPS